MSDHREVSPLRKWLLAPVDVAFAAIFFGTAAARYDRVGELLFWGALGVLLTYFAVRDWTR